MDMHESYKKIIGSLLLKGPRLVCGTRFASYIDVGDPVSQAIILDAQGADGISLVDIQASQESRVIDCALIKKITQRIHTPLAAGGGVKTPKDAAALINAGASAVIIGLAAVRNPKIVKSIAQEIGTEKLIVTITVTADGQTWKAKESGAELFALLQELTSEGAGEFILTSFDRDGTLSGLDIPLYKKACSATTAPITAAGGAGNYLQLTELFKETPCSGVALGKMLALRDYDVVRIKSFLAGRNVPIRDA